MLLSSDLREVSFICIGGPRSNNSRTNSFSCRCVFIPVVKMSRKNSYCFFRAQLSMYRVSAPNLIVWLSNSSPSIILRMSLNDERCCFLSFLLRCFDESFARFCKLTTRLSSSKHLRSFKIRKLKFAQ